MPMVSVTQLRQARTALGKTNKELQEATGVPSNTISRAMNGGAAPENGGASPQSVALLQMRLEDQGLRFTWRTDSDGNIWEGVETLAKEDE